MAGGSTRLNAAPQDTAVLEYAMRVMVNHLSLINNFKFSDIIGSEGSSGVTHYYCVLGKILVDHL